MSEHENNESAALVEIEAEVTPLTPSERILAPLELSDYSQFLYSTNYLTVTHKFYVVYQCWV